MLELVNILVYHHSQNKLNLKTAPYPTTYIVSFPPLCKGGNQDFKQDMLMRGGFFFEILVGGTKREDSIFCGSPVRELFP